MSKKPYIVDEAAGLTSLRDSMVLVVGDSMAGPWKKSEQNPVLVGNEE